MPEIVDALYDFQPQNEGDVEIRKGQQIEVYEHLSADWLRGKNMDTGHEGVFPANYVRPAEKRRSFSRPPAPPPPSQSQSDYPQPYSEKQQYQPPPPTWGQQQQYQPPQYQQYAPPQQYQPPQAQYQPPEQIMMPPQQPQQQQQPQQRHHGQFGNLARRFGDSMVFGAGATLGGDLINRIF